MTRVADSAVLSRILKVDEIRDGTRGEIAATKAEMEAIARLLDLVSLAGLLLDYRLTQLGSGRLHLAGRLAAQVTQTCVVSLEPVETSLDLPVEVEYWPAPLVAAFERSAEEGASHEILDWPESVVDGKIDLGPVIYETLATALDPYPKKEGVSFEWSQAKPQAAQTDRSGPFAALAALKGAKAGRKTKVK